MTKKKRKFIKIVSRKTPKGVYRRILIKNRVILGLNDHEFKGKQTKHIHIGEKFIKIVLKPKELRGIWKYSKERKEYVKVRGKKKVKRNRRKDKKN